MRFLLILLFLSGLHIYAPAQSSELDSLLSRFREESLPDSTRWRTALALSESYERIQIDSSEAWARRSMVLAERLDEPEKVALSHYRLGIALFRKERLTDAMAQQVNALDLFRQEGMGREQMDAELEVGRIYLRMGDYPRAKAAIKKFNAYYAKRAAEYPRDYLFSLNQFIVFFEQTGEVDSMLHYAKATLDAAQRYQEFTYLSTVHNNLAAVYLYAGNTEKAKYHFREAEKAGFAGNTEGRYFNFYALADMYQLLEEPDSSLYFARQALQVARDIGDLKKVARIHQFMSEVHESRGDYRSALKSLSTFMSVTDSITFNRHQRDLTELTVQYQTREKEAQIARQQLALQRATNRRNLVLFLSLLGFLILGGLWLYTRNRQKTKERQAALELEYQQAEARRLREMDELKSNFFANISHEFRTPLTLLLGPLRDMESGVFSADPSVLRQRMIRQGERLLSLVNQLLDLSRLESGHMQREEHPLELVRFLRTQVGAYDSWAARKNIQLEQDFPPEPVPVKVDVDKLEKILHNLLSNALKFTPENQWIRVKLQAEQNRMSARIRLSVADSGPGIPEKEQDMVFQRFYQLSEQPDGVTQGSGIGLALTRELVHFLGGQIDLYSNSGEGATFTVDLDLPKVELNEVQVPVVGSMLPTTALAETISPADTSAPVPPEEEAPVVLVVEDNDDLRRYMIEQLYNQYHILEAPNGRTGLDIATHRLPDLVLSDVRMPGMDGIHMTEALKKDTRTSHIPVILITALAEQEDVRSGLSTGADAYLTKPFDAEELRIRVHNLIEQRRQLRETFAQALTTGPHRPEPENAADTAFLQQVEQVVLSHLDDDDMSIEALGRAVGMSRSQLHRKIKALTDQSPSVFVRTIRLQRAYRLLSERRGNISEVAHEVGMPNLAYFSRSFKEQFGKPPSQI